MKYARIENDIVREIIDFDPINKFHPSLLWVECSAEVQEGWTYDLETDVFSAPIE